MKATRTNYFKIRHKRPKFMNSNQIIWKEEKKTIPKLLNWQCNHSTDMKVVSSSGSGVYLTMSNASF